MSFSSLVWKNAALQGTGKKSVENGKASQKWEKTFQQSGESVKEKFTIVANTPKKSDRRPSPLKRGGEEIDIRSPASKRAPRYRV